jgi:hypothetical protein
MGYMEKARLDGGEGARCIYEIARHEESEAPPSDSHGSIKKALEIIKGFFICQ